MEGAFIGSIIFEFIGVFFKWLYFSMTSLLSGKKRYSFKKVWHGRKEDNFKAEFEYGISNIALGMIMTLVIILLMKLII